MQLRDLINSRRTVETLSLETSGINLDVTQSRLIEKIKPKNITQT